MNFCHLIKDKQIKTIIVNQFFGLGDILFSIPIFVYFKNKFNIEIIWPVESHFLNIAPHFPEFTFVDKNSIQINYNSLDVIIDNNTLIIPLRYANNILSNGDTTKCMSDKYSYVELDLNIWKTLLWKRNTENENSLFYDELLLQDNEPYNFIANTFSFNLTREIIPTNNFKNVYLNPIKSFSMLDWQKVISNAKNIYTVGTSINFMIEVVPTPFLNEYGLYARFPHELNCNNYNYLLAKPTFEVL